MSKYPDIKVKLVGEDGNGFAVVARVSGALRKAGVPSHEITEFQKDATSGDYSHLLAVAGEWVTIK